MAYIDSLLGHGEQILYVARQHLFVLFANIITELALIALFVATGVASNIAFEKASYSINGIAANTLILLICIGISILVLINGFVDYLRWTTEQYVVTDRRVMQIRGILNKRVIDSSLEKINDVELRQSLFGRILNFGTVEILTGSGEEGVNIMDRIEAPLAFKRAMIDAKQGHERGFTAPRAQTPPQADLVDELTRLAGLRDRGILSPAEFEAEKRELLLRRGR